MVVETHTSTSTKTNEISLQRDSNKAAEGAGRESHC